ncbi:MAG: PD-(D/E)XK nuclease family protein [Ilumatobacteraceae bacterium]
MTITVSTTALGAAALDALGDAVRAAKRGDPLAPVAVVVPTNTAGVMARRALGRRGGAAAIDVLTLFRVAELLGAPSLHAEGRRPVSTPIVDLAVKQVVADKPGLYAGVQHHPSTIVALRDLYRELRAAGPASLTALARTPRGSEPARVAAEVARLLAREWYDEGDLLGRAADRARTDLPSRLGRVVVHLPQRLRPLEHHLLDALAEHGDVHLVVGLTGDQDADGPVIALAEGLSGHPITAPGVPVAPADPIGRVDVVSTTDADDEVRLAVRAVLDAARGGTRFDRIAVLFPTDRPYARLVEHQLAAAGIPWNGRPGTTVAERTVPRVLTELLELDRRGVRRTALMTLLGDVPARRADGRTVPTARWERIGRAAGIVGDADWATHLPRYVADVRAGARWDADSEAAAAEELADFVAGLRDALGDPAATRPWAEWATWSEERLDSWFGARRLDRLEGAERAAWEHTSRVLDRLHHLDALGGPVTRAEFRATFVAELEIAPGRLGKVGDGIHVSTLAGAAGIDVDVVVVVGAADGLVPPAPVVDPLIGDAERDAAGLESSDERAAAVHRQFLAAVASTPVAYVTVPRGDLRATAVRHESRWLTALAERAPGAVARRDVDSHADGLSRTEFPVSLAEHRLRALWTRVRAGDDMRDLPLVAADDAMRRALLLRDARADDTFSEFDGNLSSRGPFPLTGPISPSRIEAWAACPHAYFVQFVLGVRPIDEPAAIETLSALDRGSAMHEAIDRLQHAVLDGTIDAPGPEGWGPSHRSALLAAAVEVADELRDTGRTGRTAFWVNQRAELLATLDRWLTFDGEAWAGRTLRLSEARFGDAERVVIGLPDGREIAFRGTIDRVDELPDGSLVVTDHKTGRPGALGKLGGQDPTLGATRFQLPVYGVAARTLMGRADADVQAEYTFFKPDFSRVSLTFDDDVWARVADDLALVVDGIERGVFPARPEPPVYRLWVPCECCEPDGLGTAGPWSEWQRKRHDPAVARWFGDPPAPDVTAVVEAVADG